MTSFAIVFDNDPRYVAAVVDWEEGSGSTPPTGYSMIPNDDETAVPGGTFENGIFVQPPQMEPPET